MATESTVDVTPFSAPARLAMAALLVGSPIVFWGELRAALSWWWGLLAGDGAAPGLIGLLVFGVGLFLAAALFVGVVTAVGRAADALGGAFAGGWRGRPRT